jgi:hypothetical protein
MNIPTMKTNNRDMLVSHRVNYDFLRPTALVVMMHAGRYRSCDDGDSYSRGVRVLLDRCASAEGEKAKNGESFH